MFVKANDRYVNLKNVSTINLVKNKNRIVYNLNYSIEINLGKSIKEVSDYAYSDSDTYDGMMSKLEHLHSIDYFKENFIDVLGDGFINKESISSIKFIDEKHRVIFNFNHNIEISKDNSTVLSAEFTYVNCTSEEYGKYKNYIIEMLEL